MPGIAAHAFLKADRYPHGTRSRYVAGKCRCALCRKANCDHYHERRRRSIELAAEVVPNGPPATIVIKKMCYGRGAVGKLTEFTMRLCPGVCGEPCPKRAQLRAHAVCSTCRERATVWNGPVTTARAIARLKQLSALGIGYKSVAEAAKVSHTVIAQVLSGQKKQIRRETERRILAVDQDARADHSIIDSKIMLGNIAWLREQGFTMRQLNEMLGYQARTGIYILVSNATESGRCLAINDAKVDRIARRAHVGELQRAPPHLVPSGPTRKLVKKLLKEGFTREEIGRRIGWLPHQKWRRTVKASTAAKVRALHDEVLAGDGPDESALEMDLYEIRRVVDPSTPLPEDERDRRAAAEERAKKRQRMLEAWREGLTDGDLESRFDIDPAAIARMARKAGVRRGEAAA